MIRKPFKEDERGAVLPIVVLFIALIFFVVAALVIDVGRLYSERRVLVTAADSGALAGAKEMQRWGSDEEEVIQAAIDAAKYNGASEDKIEVIVNMGENNINEKKVEVTVENTVDLFFAKAFGINSTKVPARAVARPMRLNPGILPIGIDMSKAYVNEAPKTGLLYLHGDKTDPSFFADLLNLDGKSGGASDITNIISDRYYELGDGFETTLSNSGTIEVGGGWKTLKDSIGILFDKAYNYSTDVSKRQAFMTVLAPVYKSIDGKSVKIHEFAEMVIVDMITPKSKETQHLGLAEAFPVTISGNSINVNYSSQVGSNRNIFPKQDGINNVDIVVGYFTGTTVSINDVLNGNYQGTLYDQLEFDAVSLVE